MLRKIARQPNLEGLTFADREQQARLLLPCASAPPPMASSFEVVVDPPAASGVRTKRETQSAPTASRSDRFVDRAAAYLCYLETEEQMETSGNLFDGRLLWVRWLWRLYGLRCTGLHTGGRMLSRCS